MPVETPGIWRNLNPNWPTGADPCLDGDNHIRLLKQSLLIQFPNLEATVVSTADELNAAQGGSGANPFQVQLTALNEAVAALGGLASAGLTFEVGDLKAGFYSQVPENWLLCDFREVSRTTYATLFAKIGIAAGPGDGNTTFNLPDFRGRTFLGAGTGDAVAATAHTLGQKGGEERVRLALGEMPQHSHLISFNDDAASGGVRDSLQPTGSGESRPTSTVPSSSTSRHENMMPYTGVNVFIKYQ